MTSTLPTGTPTATVTPTETATLTETPTPTLSATAAPMFGGTFPIGAFDDANVVGDASSFQNEVNDLKAHHLDSLMLTNGSAYRDGGILGVADQAGLNVYWGPAAELNSQWWPTTVPADATTAANVIRPLVTAVAGHSSLKGTYLVDEPGLNLATKVALGAQAFRQLDPGRPLFPVLIGVNVVGPLFQASNADAMVIDVYPFGSTNAIGDFTMTGFGYSNLDMVQYIRTVTSTRPATKPLWIILQTHSFGTPGQPYTLRTPTPSEVRAEHWLALGEGAHGIFWFIYSSEQGWTGLKDNPTLFNVVSSLAQRVSPLRPALASTYKTADGFTATYAPSPGVPTPSATPYASTLTDGTNTYVVVVNMDCVNGQNLSISSTLSGSLQSLESGQVYALNTPIYFQPGDGTIFKLISGSSNGGPGVSPTPSPTNTPATLSSSYSDEFSVGGPTPSAQWTFVGGGTSSANVNNQAPGKLRIDIDTSASRGCWVGSPGCLRLVETAPTGDFQAEVKLDTLTPLGVSDEHSAGMIAYQDASNYLRFELQTLNEQTNRQVAAHAVIGGVGMPNVVACKGLSGLSAPIYLRVNRSGQSWALSYSQDGATFTSCGSFSQPLTVNQLGLQVENEQNYAAFPYADFDYIRVSTLTLSNPQPVATATPTRTPSSSTATPSPIVTASPTPTLVATSTPSSGSSGVPSVDPNYGQDVRTWWASHPLNPNAPGGIPIGAVPNGPGPVISLPAGGNLAATIQSTSCTSGCTIVLADGATYGINAHVNNIDHVHVISNRGSTIQGYLGISRCDGAWNYAQYDLDVVSNSQTTSAAYNGGTARQCFSNPVRDWYFKNITWDGAGGTYRTALDLATARDVVCDGCTFQNYDRTNTTYEVGAWSGDRGVNNLWCRGCHFVSGPRMAIFWDGLHGGGVINSTFDPNFYAMYIDVSVNDDYTVDLNGDGVYQLNEQRNGQYVVFASNVFNNPSSTVYEGLNIKAMQSLVQANTVSGGFPGNGTTSYDFLRYNAQCSHRMYGSPSQYLNEYHWVLGNTITGSTPVFAKWDASSGDTSSAGCSGTNPGPVGKYAIDNNTVAQPPAGFAWNAVIGTLDGPNEMSGNSP